MKKLVSHLSLLSLLIFGVSLGDVVESEATSDTPEVPQETWGYVGQYRAKIVPEQVRVFTMPTSGKVSGLIEPGHVTKGIVIAKINEEELELDRKSLEVDILKEKVSKNDEILKLKKDLDKIKFAKSLTVDEQRWNKDQVESGSKETILQTVKEKINLAERQLELLESQKRADFRKKEEACIIQMPFDGRLQYQFKTKEPYSKEGMYLDAGKDIAVACDDSAFYVSINVSNPEVARIPGDNLKIELQLGNGKVLPATYAYKRVEKNNGGGNADMLVFHFKVAEENNELANSLLGSNCVAKLYFLEGDGIRSLSRMRLASLPEAEGATDWQSVVDVVEPGYEIILVGETRIFLKKKES
jgi:hypothetical protein